MKQCPKCKHEVSEKDKYCPHCGAKLKRKPDYYMLAIIIFTILMIIIPIYLSFTTESRELLPYMLSSTKELKDVRTVEQVSSVKTYYDLDSFQKQFSNVSEYVNTITNFEKELKDKYSLSTQSKTYMITVYNNYNVYFKIDYSFKLDNHNTLNIEKTFTRTSNGSEDYNFIQTSINQLSDIKIYSLYNQMNNNTKAQTLYTNLLKREKEFENKKENIGHYGFGEYDENISLVVYPDGDAFKAMLKYRITK